MRYAGARLSTPSFSDALSTKPRGPGGGHLARPSRICQDLEIFKLRGVVKVTLRAKTGDADMSGDMRSSVSPLHSFWLRKG